LTVDIEIEPIWTVVANVVTERTYGPQGLEKRRGTNLFSPKTKVYIIDWFAGTCESITVVGLSRKPKKFIRTILRVNMVENFRVKLCYEPRAIELIKTHFNSDNDSITRLSEEFAKTMCREIPNWQKELY
jgi:hypothetical protein